MRLHEALKRFNVGLETAAQFLASRGIPLESKDVNARIRDFQASALSREFGYTYSSTPTPSPRRKNEETPEVKRILEEIKNKKGNKKEKKERKVKAKNNAAQDIIGKEVSVKVKSFEKNVLITKGYLTIFTEGRIVFDDVCYKGSKLSEYWAKYFLSKCSGKMMFEVISPAVAQEGTKATYARLKYNVTAKDGWQSIFSSLKKKQEFKGKVIAVKGSEYIVKCMLQNDYCIFGSVDSNDYIDDYEVNNTIQVHLARKGQYLFDPMIFVAPTENKDNNQTTPINTPSTPKIEINQTPATGFEQWRSKQKQEIDDFYGLTPYKEKEPITTDSSYKFKKEEPVEKEPEKNIIEYSCEATFFPDYEIVGMKLSDFMFQKNKMFISNILKTHGLLVRYQLLLAVAELLNGYHKQHLILKNLDPGNFIVISASPIRVKLKDDSEVSYKTSMIKTEPSSKWDAPEVINHLSPYTPMSECYSFANQVMWMLTGQLDKTLIGSNPNITHPIASLLERSFASNPMERPTLEKWKETLRSSLDEFVFCPKCKEWHPRNVDKNCPFCDTRSMFDIKLSIGTLGEGEVYDPETNALHVEKTIIGKCRWDIALNESTSKILYAYHFGIKNNPDIPIAVITVTNCNDNNEMTLCVTPMLNTRITHVDPNYEMIGIPFNEQTNIEFDRNLISDSVFLVENNMFKNKIIKLCHI